MSLQHVLHALAISCSHHTRSKFDLYPRFVFSFTSLNLHKFLKINNFQHPRSYFTPFRFFWMFMLSSWLPFSSTNSIFFPVPEPFPNNKFILPHMQCILLPCQYSLHKICHKLFIFFGRSVLQRNETRGYWSYSARNKFSVARAFDVGKCVTMLI